MFKNIDFHKGEIIRDIFNEKIDNTELSNDNFDLEEDMFQVKYGEYIIDVGWYMGVESFIIFVIKKYDWENPVIKEYCKDWAELEKKMQYCVDRVDDLIQAKL